MKHKMVIPAWHHTCNLNKWGLVILDWSIKGMMDNYSACERDLKRKKCQNEFQKKCVLTVQGKTNKYLITVSSVWNTKETGDMYTTCSKNATWKYYWHRTFVLRWLALKLSQIFDYFEILLPCLEFEKCCGSVAQA